MSQSENPSDRSEISPTVAPGAMPAYLTGVGSWFGSMGLQFVMIPTLVIITLGASATQLAIAQMTLSLPQLFLLLYAGAIADQTNGRRSLITIHLLAAMPPAILGWLVWTASLAYWHMLVFAVAMGVLSAFSAPTRDALLPRVTNSDIQNAVMKAMITQFAAQILGFTLAGIMAPLAGPWALPVMQSLALLVGLAGALALPDMPPIAHKPSEEDPEHIADHGWRTGVHIVANSPTLYPVVLSTLSVGMFFIGIFMVALPLIVRNVFDGGQLEISIMSLIFWGGTICTTVLMMRLRPIVKRGRAMVLALFVGSIMLLLIGFAPSFWIFCLLAGGWGLAAGVNMTMSRTIVQVEAPAHARARVMAIYNLGFLGAAPFGAMITGLVAEYLGPQQASAVFALLMIGFTIWLCLFTPVLKIGRHASEMAATDATD